MEPQSNNLDILSQFQALNLDINNGTVNEDGSIEQCMDIKEFLWANSTDLTSLPVVMGLFALLYSGIVLTAVLGNLLVILSVCRHKSLQSVRNIFIVSLSCSDVVVSIVSGTITPIMSFTKIWPFGEILCKWVPVIQGASLCFSTLTLTSIAIDRFLLIVLLPLRPSIQRRCACRIVAFNSFLACAISLPMLFKQTMVDWAPFCGQFCTEDWTNSSIPRSIYGTFVFFAQFVVPFLIISTCYVLISVKINSGIIAKRASTEMAARFSDIGTDESCATARTARVGKLSGSGAEEGGGSLLLMNGQKRGQGSRQSTCCGAGGGGNEAMKLALEQRKSVLNRRLRTHKMLITMVAVFFCCWAPSVLFNFLRDQQWLPDWVMAQEYLFGTITHCISMSSTIWNPVLYALLNEQFRTAFSEQFKQLRHCLKTNKSGFQQRRPSSSYACDTGRRHSTLLGKNEQEQRRQRLLSNPNTMFTLEVSCVNGTGGGEHANGLKNSQTK